MQYRASSLNAQKEDDFIESYKREQSTDEDWLLKYNEETQTEEIRIQAPQVRLNESVTVENWKVYEG